MKKMQRLEKCKKTKNAHMCTHICFMYRYIKHRYVLKLIYIYIYI